MAGWQATSSTSTSTEYSACACGISPADRRGCHRDHRKATSRVRQIRRPLWQRGSALRQHGRGAGIGSSGTQRQGGGPGRHQPRRHRQTCQRRWLTPLVRSRSGDRWGRSRMPSVGTHVRAERFASCWSTSRSGRKAASPTIAADVAPVERAARGIGRTSGQLQQVQLPRSALWHRRGRRTVHDVDDAAVGGLGEPPAISLASALQRRARSQTRQQRPELRYEAADEGWPGGEGTNRGSVAVDHARLCSTGAP